MLVDPLVLFRYTCWANDRVMAGVEQLSEELLMIPIRPEFQSVFGLLVHIMSAEHIWLSRWKGISPTSLLTTDNIPDLKTLKAAWSPLRAEMLGYLAGVGDANQIVVYRTTKGVEYQDVLWHLVLHLVNHATEHRSQAALYMATHGIDLGNLDFIVYVREVMPD